MAVLIYGHAAKHAQPGVCSRSSYSSCAAGSEDAMNTAIPQKDTSCALVMFVLVALKHMLSQLQVCVLAHCRGPVIGEALSAGLANPSSSGSDSLDATTSSGTSNSMGPAAGAAAATTPRQDYAAALPGLEPASSMSSGHHALLCALWQRYCSALETSPLLTKVSWGAWIPWLRTNSHFHAVAPQRVLPAMVRTVLPSCLSVSPSHRSIVL